MYKIDLKNKKGIIFGLANEKSLAWGIAKLLDSSGAKLILACQYDPLFQKERFEKLSQVVDSLSGNHFLISCDVQFEASVEKFFSKVKKHCSRLDFLIHSLAFAPRQALKNPFLETSRKEFLETLLVSSYSLIELTRMAEPLMKKKGSIVALTYLGSERAVSHYNVMGSAKAVLEHDVKQLAFELGRKKKIRVNAISAGPIETLSSRGIPEFSKILKIYEGKAPLGRIAREDVASLALFLVSDLSEKITGQIIFVDGGYNIVL